MSKDNDYALQLTRNERAQKVVRSVYLIQHAQYTLSLSEQRFLLYCISKVKPEDTAGKEYQIDLKDYLQVCGLRGTTSYSAIKEQIVETMRQMVLGMEEEDSKGKKTFTVYNWFSKMAITQGAGTVRFSFTPDIAQHLIGLAQYNAHTDKANQLYYISDELRYMLPFKCRYSYYLYPLLRSFQNRNEWTFPLEELRQRLDVYERMEDPNDYREAFNPKSNVTRKPIHQRFADFRRSVLDPAMADINNYSNIKCAYRPEKKGKAVVAVTFIFENKNDKDRFNSVQRGMLVLDRTDDLTQTIHANVPDPEEPLEFCEAYNVGDDTTPPSAHVKKKSKEELKQESIERVRKLTVLEQVKGAIMSPEPPKSVNFGKRGPRNPSKDAASANIDKVFPIDRGEKQGSYAWFLSDIAQHGKEIGGNYAAFAASCSPDTYCSFLLFAINNYGAIRLKESITAERISIYSGENSILIGIRGKTPALDMSKFIHRIFGDPEELKKIYDVFAELPA